MILDAGVLYAAADRSDDDHAACRRLLESAEEMVVPEPVVTEVDYLLLTRLGVDVELTFLRSLIGRWFSVECPTPADRARAVELVERYRDARIGYVDAATVAIAERLGEHRIATLDRRHFSLITPRHVEAFELVP